LEIKPKPVRPARAHAASAAERAAHGQMVKALKNALWDKESA
jgi:hypothetical protein